MLSSLALLFKVFPYWISQASGREQNDCIVNSSWNRSNRIVKHQANQLFSDLTFSTSTLASTAPNSDQPSLSHPSWPGKVLSGAEWQPGKVRNRWYSYQFGDYELHITIGQNCERGGGTVEGFCTPWKSVCCTGLIISTIHKTPYQTCAHAPAQPLLWWQIQIQIQPITHTNTCWQLQIQMRADNYKYKYKYTPTKHKYKCWQIQIPISTHRSAFMWQLNLCFAHHLLLPLVSISGKASTGSLLSQAFAKVTWRTFWPLPCLFKCRDS